MLPVLWIGSFKNNLLENIDTWTFQHAIDKFNYIVKMHVPKKKRNASSASVSTMPGPSQTRRHRTVPKVVDIEETTVILEAVEASILVGICFTILRLESLWGATSMELISSLSSTKERFWRKNFIGCLIL